HPWVTDLIDERRSKTKGDPEDECGGEKSERWGIDGGVLSGSNHRAIVVGGLFPRIRERLACLLHERLRGVALDNPCTSIGNGRRRGRLPAHRCAQLCDLLA